MTKPIMVLDTSIFAVWLEVPMVTPQTLDDVLFDKTRIEEELTNARTRNADLILPLASVLEAGNHILKARSGRFEAARRLKDVLVAAVEGRDAWVVFTREAEFLREDGLRELGERFVQEATKGKPKSGLGGLSIADLSIARIARYYADAGRLVTILTTDRGLKAEEPPQKPRPQQPTRRR